MFYIYRCLVVSIFKRMYGRHAIHTERSDKQVVFGVLAITPQPVQFFEKQQDKGWYIFVMWKVAVIGLYGNRAQLGRSLFVGDVESCHATHCIGQRGLCLKQLLKQFSPGIPRLHRCKLLQTHSSPQWEVIWRKVSGRTFLIVSLSL